MLPTLLIVLLAVSAIAVVTVYLFRGLIARVRSVLVASSDCDLDESLFIRTRNR